MNKSRAQEDNSIPAQRSVLTSATRLYSLVTKVLLNTLLVRGEFLLSLLKIIWTSHTGVNFRGSKLDGYWKVVAPSSWSWLKEGDNWGRAQEGTSLSPSPFSLLPLCHAMSSFIHPGVSPWSSALPKVMDPINHRLKPPKPGTKINLSWKPTSTCSFSHLFIFILYFFLVPAPQAD